MSEDAQRAIGRLEGKMDMMLSLQDEQNRVNEQNWTAVRKSMHMVDDHEDWINQHGIPTARKVNETHARNKGVLIGITLGSGAIGALIVKIVQVVGPFGH